MSSYKGVDLFGSGPHRFAVGPRGERVVPNYVLGAPGSGSTPTGPIEVDVVVRGRLTGSTLSQLWSRRDAIAVQLTSPPVAGTLIDEGGRSWADMSFIGFEEGDRVERGRVWSVAYRAVFRGFI